MTHKDRRMPKQWSSGKSRIIAINGAAGHLPVVAGGGDALRWRPSFDTLLVCRAVLSKFRISWRAVDGFHIPGIFLLWGWI